ncbi:MAG: hypothetical protein AMXMBFR56_41280 [Polyangiaceae bacterium]
MADARPAFSNAARIAKVERTLLLDDPDADADQCLLHQAVAHDAVLAERLGHVQLLLAERLVALVENPRAASTLARVLRELTSTRAATTRRVQELLLAAAALRSHRRLSGAGRRLAS